MKCKISIQRFWFVGWRLRYSSSVEKIHQLGRLSFLRLFFRIVNCWVFTKLLFRKQLFFNSNYDIWTQPRHHYFYITHKTTRAKGKKKTKIKIIFYNCALLYANSIDCVRVGSRVVFMSEWVWAGFFSPLSSCLLAVISRVVEEQRNNIHLNWHCCYHSIEENKSTPSVFTVLGNHIRACCEIPLFFTEKRRKTTKKTSPFNQVNYYNFWTEAICQTIVASSLRVNI